MPVNTLFSAVTPKEAPDGRYLPSAKTGKAAGQVSDASPHHLGEFITFASLLVLLIACLVLAGCGSSGYAGAGITGLSNSAITIDAGQSFPVTATLSGDSALVSWTLAGSTCSGSACGSLSSQTGTAVTYTAPAGLTSQMKLTLTAAVSGTSNLSKTSITVNPDPTISGTAPAGTVGTPYSVALKTSGGTAPVKWSMTGALPNGLTFDTSTATISGTPTTVGSSNVTVQIVDSSDVPYTVKASQVIAISTSGSVNNGGALTLAGNPPAGKVGVAYTSTLTASGGEAPYTWSVASGALPAGLTLSASAGVISGTPTAAGTDVFTAQVEDSTGTKASASFSITIASATSGSLTISSPPNGTVGTPYTGAVGVSGGTAPYNCVLASGTMPAGLTFIPTCAITGTPTAAGTSLLVVTATDSSNPALTKTGPATLTIASGSITLNLSTLPGATIGVPYSATIGVSGGTAPYTCVQAGGTLPNGLGLSTACVVSGTPTLVGPFTFNVKANDSSSPSETVTGPESITVSPTPLTITATNLPDATVGTAYTATIPVSGGTAPYNCAILAGPLPAGLSNTGCVVSGTPTVAGSVSLTVKATDASSPMESYTGPVGLKVLPASITLVITSPPGVTAGTPYTGTVGVTGGTAPYTCTLAPGSAPLPTGLTLGSNCVLSGTTTDVGSFPVTVTATDTSNPVVTKTGPVTVTVTAPTSTLTLSSPPNAFVNVPYTGTIGVAGGTAPYTCVLAPGSNPMPANLTLGANCVVTGTPTTIGATTITVTATDSASPTPNTKTGPVVITVTAVPKLTLAGSLPNATLGVPYTQTLTAMGGVTPYTYTLTHGTLPAGITLASDGTISGTPTAVGASSFTVTVTDTETTPQTASLPLVLLVVYPTTPNDSELVGPYAFLFQGYDDEILGVLSYQMASVGSFTADGTGVISAGEQDANHQTSNPTGNTISSQEFLGTYTLATDNTGSLTLSTLNSDGTTTTSTYAITVKAPVAPATVATSATFIETDSGGLTGTRGSASMLAQTASSFTAGLNGSYAFGMSGDTPCIPACTVGLVAGPVASVGQFKTSGTGAIASGSSDANDATTNYANAALTGTYSAADDNGRLDLAMTTAGTPAATYPVDYAVYLVDASHAFVMSTDKHSTFDLLAGDAQLQTQATFSNASLNGPFIGYENAQASPGLLTTTLQTTLSLSTATIFRATGNATGTCNTTTSDTGGLTTLVNGIGTGIPVLQALLGTYQSLGSSACTVAANGRGVLKYPAPSNVLTPILLLLGLSTTPPAPRELYLVSPNSGYFLETGYAGLGKFEAQTGAPFSLATLDGTYLYTSLPAASVASITSSGTLAADGNGSATTTLDTSVLAGNLNALTLGQTNTSTYALADGASDGGANDATVGRYTFGTDVIYAISPTRFVLVDTSALATSPTVSLLY